MPLPSLYIWRDGRCAWSMLRAASYGAVIGAAAGVFKTLDPLHAAGVGSVADKLAAHMPEIIGAAVAFALLGAGGAALRSFLVQRLSEFVIDQKNAGRPWAAPHTLVSRLPPYMRAMSTF